MASEVEDSSTVRVTVDVPCASCRYNLRTLELTGACPECGHSVAETVRQSLFSADPESLADLHSAAGVFLWTTLAAVSVATLCGIGLAALRDPFQKLGAFPNPFAILMAIGLLNGLVLPAGLVLRAELLRAIKCALVARAGDPGATRTDSRGRMTVVLLYVFGVLLCASVTGDPVSPVLLAISSLIVALPTYLGAQIRRLTARGGDVGTARLAGVTVLLGAIGLFLLVVSLVAVVPVVHARLAPGMTSRYIHEAAFLVGIAVVPLAITPVWTITIVVLIRFRRALRRAMTMADTLENIGMEHPPRRSGVGSVR